MAKLCAGRQSAVLTPSSRAERGFLLPLASSAALLLLLSSLSLQAMALQQRARLAAQQRQRGWDDRLMSAAQAFTGQLQRHHRCRLSLPASQWAAQPCQPAGTPGGILEPAIVDAGIRLVAYCPDPGTPPQATLVLELAELAPPQRAIFRLALAPGETPEAPLRVVDLHEGGRLRGQALPAACPGEAP
jgi:hypothetical protein